MTSDNVTPVARSGIAPDPQRVSVSTGGNSRRRRPKPGRGRKAAGGGPPPAVEEYTDAPGPSPRADEDGERGPTVDVCA